MENGFIAAESTVQENTKNKDEISEQDKGGFISNLISNFVSSGGDHDDENKDGATEKIDIVTREEDVKDSEESGGLLNSIFSNMISSSSSPRSVEANKRKLDEEDLEPTDREKAQKIEQEDGGKGVFNNIISNLFHHSEGNDDDGDKQGSVEEIKDVVVTEKKDVAVPSTDEASILIAIARD